jgi:hypothetical protein
MPGARAYRQILSTKSTKNDASPEVLSEAYSMVEGNIPGTARIFAMSQNS